MQDFIDIESPFIVLVRLLSVVQQTSHTVGRKKRALHLRSEVRRWILAGQVSPGQALPSRREMARKFGVSLWTAQRALNELRGDGYVQADSTRGTFVVDR